MTTFYFVRHGKSSMDGAEEERGLEPEGFVHADQIAARLLEQKPTVTKIVSSPYQRARLSMEPLAKKIGLPITTVDAFHEKLMSDQPIADMKATRINMWTDFDFILPGGESNRQAQTRAVDAVNQLCKEHDGAVIAVGSHGTLIGLILNAYDPTFGFEDWRAMPMPDIVRIDFTGGNAPVITRVGVPAASEFRVDG